MLSDAGIRLLALSPPAAHDPTQTPPPSTAVGQPPPTTRGTLRALGLAHCGLLTDGAVEAILQLSVLKELDARDLTLVTTEARSRLQKRWPQALVSCS